MGCTQVDSVCREQGDKLVAMEEETKQRLAALQLPQLVRAAEGHAGALPVPQSVRALVDELEHKGGATAVLQDMVQQQQQLRSATAEMLMQVSAKGSSGRVVRAWRSCEPCYQYLLVPETVRCRWC
jgi:ATP/maltotriose-dependent transcriptional regulator MalT